MARWPPSIEAAKARCVANAAECVPEESIAPPPVVTFVEAGEDEDGNPCEPYLRVMEDGRWQASIRPERAAWPTSQPLSYGDSPPLVMTAIASRMCSHHTLTCSGTTHPRIVCSACGQIWTPT